jgi:hypothetical protein
MPDEFFLPVFQNPESAAPMPPTGSTSQKFFVWLFQKVFPA